MKNYEATVRAGSNYIVVRVQAQGLIQAKWQLEAVYGVGNIVHLPRETTTIA